MHNQFVLLIAWILDGDFIYLPYLFTISPSSDYLLRWELKQSKKLSRQSARHLIKDVCLVLLWIFSVYVCRQKPINLGDPRTVCLQSLTVLIHTMLPRILLTFSLALPVLGSCPDHVISTDSDLNIPGQERPRRMITTSRWWRLVRAPPRPRPSPREATEAPRPGLGAGPSPGPGPSPGASGRDPWATPPPAGPGPPPCTSSPGQPSPSTPGPCPRWSVAHYI